QGTFSLYKHYPSFGIEKTIHRNNIIRLTFGGGPLANKQRSSYYNIELPYHLIYHSDFDRPSSSRSNFTGALIKISTLGKIYKNKKVEIRGGFDFGGYYIIDSYKMKMHNDSSHTEYYENGKFFSKAISIGMLANFKMDIGKGWFINIFPQGMFYFDSLPRKPSHYDWREPFFNWEIELGAGIGYTIIR
ncbi:MAG: hypothetical protein ACXVDW_21415, partial [Bacteroidia bacterium]